MNEKIKKSQKVIQRYLPKEGEKGIDYSQLPSLMSEMLTEYSVKQFYDVVEDSLLMDIVVLFSILACSRRVEIESPLGYPTTFPNFYLIRLMPSSYGKDSPFDTMVFDLAWQIKEGLEEDYEAFVSNVKKKPYLMLPRLKTYLQNYCQSSDPEALKEAYEDLTRDDPLKKTPEPFSFSFEMSNATLQGFASYLEWLQLFGKGCAFLKMSEFGSYITGNEESKKDFLTGLNNAWENKPVETKKIQKYIFCFSIILVMGNSSSFWVTKDEDREKLYKFINMGFGRRFFIFQPDEVVSQEKSQMSYEQELERMESSINKSR